MEYTRDKRYCRVPERVGRVVRDVMSAPGIRRMESETKLFSAWPKIAGEAVAEVSTPVDIRNGALVLKVENAVWRNELHYMKAHIIKRVNEEAGTTRITNVIFR